MKYNQIVDIVESQVIASIENPNDIQQVINSEANIAFLLTGDLLMAKNYIDQLKSAGIKVFIHLDFITGISNSRSAIQYIAQKWRPDGIISTKGQPIQFAKKEGLLTIQRIFLIDHNAIAKGKKMAKTYNPDAIEVLPGIMPRVIYELTDTIPHPVIAGGLVKYKEEITQALEAGALAVSGGNANLWNLGL